MGECFMYFVDRNEIEKTLQYIDHLLEIFSNYSYESAVEELALERLVHMLIEGMIDVGTMMIDGFIMRDAGSYEDIIDILVDEEVVPEEKEESFKAIIRLRQEVVRDYLEIDHATLKETLQTHYDALCTFSTYILNYLEKEMDVANTFLNEESDG